MMQIDLKKAGRYSFPMGILDFALDANESNVYAACMDGLYRLPLPPKDAIKEGAKPISIGRQSSYVSGVGLVGADSTAVTCNYDGTLQMRNVSPDCVEDVAPTLEQRLHSFWSWSMALSPDKQWIASVGGQYLAGSEDYSPLASPEPTVKLVDLHGKTKFEFEMLPSVQAVAFDPTGKYLAAGNLMGDLAVWSTETGEALAKWRTKSFTSWGIIKSHCYIGGIFAVSFSPDSQTLYAAGMGDMKDPMAGNGKQLWERFDWQKSPPEKIQESRSNQTGEGLMETLAWHPQGTMFAMAGRLRGGNWNVGLFDRDSGELIGSAKTGMRITSACFSQDGKTLYLGGMQGQPERKEGRFPDFGYLERYNITESA
jgi:WD40 repeat protein